MTTIPAAEILNDTRLVELSRNGNRDAFGRIVERYQSLISALTYSACGNLQASEDLAQVTFITAWCQLKNLREPAKLKSWLCRIARNATVDSLRHQQRTPTANAEDLDATTEIPSPALTPRDQAVSKEEEAILWRSLSELPLTYREPLVLFYRQHQSVAEVADALEVSEDVVRQRLARGRAMLSEKVTAFVEDTLRQTTPGLAFSQAVLAALPLAAASTGAAGVGTAAKGATATKSAGLFAWFLPLLGILGGITAHCLIARSAPTERQRRAKLIFVIGIWVFVLTWAYPLHFALRSLGAHLGWSDPTFYATLTGFWWIFSVAIVTVATLSVRRNLAILGLGGQPAQLPLNPGTRLVIAAGMYLAYFWGLIFMARQADDRLWAGIITAIMVVLGAGHFLQLRGKAGITAMRAAIVHMALALGMILVLLNLRLDVWLASYRGVSLSEIHQLLPMWVVHLLTLALVIWVGLLLAVTRTKVAGRAHR